MKKSKYPVVSEEIFNTRQDALQKLAALFPGVVKDGAVDFETLKAELGDFEEVGEEKYRLTWAGKQAAVKTAQEDVLGRTLRYVPEESKNADTTENLYIEGDNLEVLKLLRQNYYAAIKMIYIDPPYNTGNDFVYRDSFTQDEMESELEEGNITAEGERLVRNQRSTNRFHANWLNMMYPRLRIARDLLSEDGVIFISIDDNEVANLRKICDEVFGEDNFVADIIWEKRFTRSNNSKMFASLIDHILLYRKCATLDNIKEPRNDKADSIYSNPDNDQRGVWTSVSYVNPATREQRPNLCYGIINPITGKTVTHPTNAWKYEKATHDKHVEEDRLYWGKSGENTYPRLKKFLSDLDGGMVPVNLWKHETTGTTDAASKELEELMSCNVFDFPKPPSLIKRALNIVVRDGDTILDFFSGSGTTAHAVMQLNAEDGGRRKFIMVQIPETTAEDSEAFKAGYKTICEIGKERIRRAGEKIKAELVEKQKKNGKSLLDDGEPVDPESLDFGFKVFKTDDTMIRWTHAAINDDKTLFNEAMLSDKEKLDFMPHFTDVDVAYEILLRQHDVSLSAKMEQLTKIGNRTWCFADSYVVCLEEKITAKLVEKLAAIEPTPFKYVFRDSAFGDDIALKDETMRRLDANIKKNTGEKKKTYTVEFL